MLKKVGAIAAIAATVAVVVAATLGGTASAKSEKNPLCKTASLGFAGPLTGGAAFLGKDQSNWVKLMIKNWNAGKAMPGVPKSLHRVKLNLALLGDSQLNPQVAATVGRQMVANKKILGMVGFAGSNEELGGGPVLDGAKLPYVTGSATKDTLATGAPGQKPLKYFFRVVPINSTQAKAGVAYIVPKLKLNKGSKIMIVDDGEAYGIDISNAAQKAFKAAGITKITRESVKETDANPGGAAGFAADMAPVALKAATGGYKLVYAPSQDAPDSQSFVEQLKTDGYKGGFMATDGSVSPTQFKFPGAYVSFFGPGIEKINKTYVKQFKATYGAASATDPFGAPSFVAAQMLATAISQQCAASHGSKISRALVAKKLAKVKLSTTILGYSMAFNNPADADHGPKSGVTVFQIQANGSYKEVYAAG
ncbi:MAG TPA: branched-chain amino acid ABC transporter substrate-binding protein [Gaiellaceae bacterium]|nr:branched-chain amino acid ABC transporter substrate-binding protein [Gaiellaceae bacterium]